MIVLGFWQLDRMREKEAMLASYAAAESNTQLVRFPDPTEDAIERALYRQSQVECRTNTGWNSTGARSRRGQAGFKHVALCDIADGRTAYVAAGWSREPVPPVWEGGRVTGIIGPGGPAGARLYADPAVAGLDLLAKPDPADMPNNHLAYAVQWFAFAFIALVIYILALRRRAR